MTEKENNCQGCAEILLEQNRELWAEAAQRIGDSTNTDWCSICDQLFMKDGAPLRFYHDIEDDN
jgi:hypothetical protein